MKRVLCVLSTWKPAFLADVQRVRVMTEWLASKGWEVEIMHPDASYQPGYSLEPEGGKFCPPTQTYTVGPWMEWAFQLAGSRTVGVRACVPIARKGMELLRSRKFDMVYFSTTQHQLTCAGPWWRRKTGVPYVADVHDPVFIPKPKYRTSRSRFKGWLGRELGRWIEKRALAQADGIVSVSRGYVEDLLLRHPAARWAVGERGSGVQGLSNEGKLERVLVQPFPADERGLEMVKAERRETGKKRIVYVGAGGTIMEKGLREFLAALKDEPLRQDVKIEIWGTNPFWKESEPRFLQSIAKEVGLAGNLIEEPSRISYERSLALAKGADGLLVLGVDDQNYQPSKLHTYLASGLPVMVLCHEQSDLPRQLQGVQGVHVLRFGGGKIADSGKRQVEGEMRGYLQSVKDGTRWPGRKRLTADQAAAAHVRLFNAIASLS